MRAFRALFIVALLTLAVTAFVFLAPFGPTSETLVTIPSGTGTLAIAQTLEDHRILRNRFAFDLLRLAQGGTLHAGVYRFDHPAPVTEIYARIVRGDVYTRGLSIPEGYNLFDIAKAVELAGLGDRETFLAAARHQTELIADYAPHAASLEGFLFPATYRFTPGTPPEQMLAAMVRRFRLTAAQLNLEHDLARTVLIASLIEKEVGQPEERALVAGVFQNRLNRGMPLQTDPTVIYAALLEGRYRGTIYRSDLQSASPYNTYRHTGLPPGPICNPGLAALQAALHPAPTDALYFVSDGAGHTRFAASLHEHAGNVQAYRTTQHTQALGTATLANP